MKIILSIFIALTLTACALPETGVRTGSPRPTLYIKGDVKGMDLFIDGIQIGLAEQFNGNPKVLVVEEGAHIVQIKKAGSVVHSEKTFVSNGESRAIIVNAGTK